MSSTPVSPRRSSDGYSPPSSYTLHADQSSAPHSESAQLAQRLGTSPYPALLLSGLSLSLLPGARKSIRGYPSVMQCNTYTALFGAAAYALSTGDSVNGSGIVSCWSAVWLFFNARNAMKSKRILPISVAGAVASIGTAYAYHYATFSQKLI